MIYRLTRRTYLSIFVIALCGAAIPLGGQSPEDAQRLVTGQITDINIKKHILTIRPGPIDQAPRSPSPGTNRGNRGGTGGGTSGRGGRRGGTGIPFPTPSSKNQAKTFKVTVTDETVIKDSVTSISFGLLRAEDRVTIRGIPIKGKPDDLKATEITVNN
jgi:hypothetical protein